jgi:hypothetical protein
MGGLSPVKVTLESEGMRRLAIVCGVIGAITWLVFIGKVSNGFSEVQPVGWLILVLGVPVSFALGFVVVWAVDWVMAGFVSSRSKGSA